MTWMPFICLAVGFALTMKQPPDRMIKTVDGVINGALILLMLVIGMNIGINDSVIKNLGPIGLNCTMISLAAIAGSVLCVLLLEKTVLPLEKIREKVLAEDLHVDEHLPESGENHDDTPKEEKKSHLVWIMPAGIVTGTVAGYFLLPQKTQNTLDILLLISLVFLYTGVGFSMGTNRNVFRYVKRLGAKIVLISVAIFIGSAGGGLLAGLLCGEPAEVSLMSACGMSYYSITGAYMTQSYGIEVGTYGFVVNVMREFFTVLLMPLLIKISKGSPIAGGAAGNMDTMLVPVTKFVGAELGLVALITGVILTFAVPIQLPLLAKILTMGI